MSLGKIIMLAVAAMTHAVAAGGLREEEVCAAVALHRVEVCHVAIDLRDRWTVETVSAIEFPYAASPGATVGLNLQNGTLVMGVFTPDVGYREIATGLTGTGTYTWLPSGVGKELYRVQLRMTHGGQNDEDETYNAYFDFAECKIVTEADFRNAVLSVSQLVTAVNDANNPWVLIGGDGEGLCNNADGATLTFAFTGAGSFAADLCFADGTVTVAVDGETVAAVDAAAEWTRCAWPVDGDGLPHTLTLTYNGSAEVGVRRCALMQDVRSQFGTCEVKEMAIDCRAVFPVKKLENEPKLQGFAYSAIGWELDPVADASRTVRITARAGALIDGIFTPDGSAEMTVLAATMGAGTTDWHPSSVSKKVYQLTHTVKKSGVVDVTATLYGYLDFSKVDSIASQAEVETAVLGEITHPIVVRQDEQSPWQPIDSTQARSGIATDESLATENETATTFAFKGRGVLHFDYELTGGTLAAVSGDETVLTFDEPTAGWVSGQVTFTGYGAHEVAFVYTADGGMAAIRNVRWEEQSESCRANGEGGPVIVDLQEGVRTPKYLADILPFEYSSTNWIGDVAQVSVESVARVTIERLTGTDPDVRNWTEPVPGTFRELVKNPGEAAVKWHPRKGVWLATFDILNADASLHRETALFDLRNARSFGFVLIVK